MTPEEEVTHLREQVAAAERSRSAAWARAFEYARALVWVTGYAGAATGREGTYPYGATTPATPGRAAPAEVAVTICGKTRYRTGAQARAAVQAIRTRGERREKRPATVYPCEACGGWHLTSGGLDGGSGSSGWGSRERRARRERRRER